MSELLTRADENDDTVGTLARLISVTSAAVTAKKP